MSLHFMILYVPFFQTLFAIEALGWEEWNAVLLISAPVLLVDEILKAVSRLYSWKQQRGMMKGYKRVSNEADEKKGKKD
jgi:Cation transporting ATPase, C-terminus